MMEELNNTFFTRYGKHFSSQHIKKSTTTPFKDHPQLSILIDNLSRKHDHHIILSPDFSAKFFTSFTEALLFHLTQENIPYPLQNAELIYFDIEDLVPTEDEKRSIEGDFQKLKHTLDFADKNLLLAFTDISIFYHTQQHTDSFLSRQFEKLLTHPRCRFIIFAPSSAQGKNHPLLNKFFSRLNITGPTESDMAAILKQQSIDLENFHHVLIPDELLSLAYSLSERYLSTTETLEKSILLLDSSAARAGTVEHLENNHQFKPVLTAATLMNVLSGWTQIPPSHLQLNKFKLSDFIQSMQMRIFGQEAAITLLGQAFQQSQAHVQHNTGPFCGLLFVGPEHSGKRTTALALAEQLFKQLGILYYAQITSKQNDISSIKLQRCTDKHFELLKDVIRHTPHAIIMLENVDQASPTLIEKLQEIFSTGLLHEDNDIQLNLRQTIMMLSTTLGASRLATLAKTLDTDEETEPVDLMQLIMNEQKHDTSTTTISYSPQEIADEIMTDISSYIPPSLCKHLHIIPFFSLNKTAVEQIIRQKFKLLGKMLDSRYGVELGYASEVVRYLANEVLTKQDTDSNQVIDIDKALKQLYFVIEQAILSQVDNKNRPHQLFLQLNETGQVLRCDWLHMSTAREHAT